MNTGIRKLHGKADHGIGAVFAENRLADILRLAEFLQFGADALLQKIQRDGLLKAVGEHGGEVRVLFGEQKVQGLFSNFLRAASSLRQEQRGGSQDESDMKSISQEHETSVLSRRQSRQSARTVCGINEESTSGVGVG